MRRVRRAGDGDDVVLADSARRRPGWPPRAGSRRSPARRGRPRCRVPAAAVRERGEAAVPVAVVEHDRRAPRLIEERQGSALASDVALDQSGSRPRRRPWRPRPCVVVRLLTSARWTSCAMSECDSAGGSSRTIVAGRSPAAGRLRATIAPQLWPMTWRSGRSSPAARTKAARSAAVSANAGRPRPVPRPPVPGQVHGHDPVTRPRPAPAPTRHHVPADDVTPWISRSGRPPGVAPRVGGERDTRSTRLRGTVDALRRAPCCRP